MHYCSKMGKENVGAGTPLPAVTPTPKQTDAGPQVMTEQACDNAKTVAQSNAEPPITEQANAAETEKLDGILETIRGPNQVSAEPEAPELDTLDINLGAVHVTFRGEDATAIKLAVLNEHKALLDTKDAAIQTDVIVTSTKTCPDCQASANARA